MVCWRVGVLVRWFVGWFAGWFVGLLVCWFVGWLVCWLVGLLVGLCGLFVGFQLAGSRTRARCPAGGPMPGAVLSKYLQGLGV